MEVLAKRLLCDGGLQVRDQIRVPAECELGLDPGLERGPAPLLQAGDLGLREALIGKVRERRAPPELERLPEPLRRALRIGLDLGPAARQELLEAVDVPLAGVDIQSVGAAESLEPPVPAKGASQGRHLVVKHPLCRRRRRLSPQLLHQPVGCHHLVGTKDQKSQQGALTPLANRNSTAAVANDLKRAQQAKVQCSAHRNTG